VNTYGPCYHAMCVGGGYRTESAVVLFILEMKYRNIRTGKAKSISLGA